MLALRRRRRRRRQRRRAAGPAPTPRWRRGAGCGPAAAALAAAPAAAAGVGGSVGPCGCGGAGAAALKICPWRSTDIHACPRISWIILVRNEDDHPGLQKVLDDRNLSSQKPSQIAAFTGMIISDHPAILVAISMGIWTPVFLCCIGRASKDAGRMTRNYVNLRTEPENEMRMHTLARFIPSHRCDPHLITTIAPIMLPIVFLTAGKTQIATETAT